MVRKSYEKLRKNTKSYEKLGIQNNNNSNKVILKTAYMLAAVKNVPKVT